VNAYKKNQRDLNIWVGEAHGTPQGNYLTVNLSTEITFQNFIKEAIDANVDERPEKNPEIIQCAGWKRHLLISSSGENLTTSIKSKSLSSSFNSRYLE
jgi:hypothetical protein